MKQLTHAEKQELKTKIQKEKERQQTLRESNPDLPETFEEASAKTGIVRKFVPRRFWKYGFLVILLCLLAFNVVLFFQGRDPGSKKIINVSLMLVLLLLFNHIASYLTTKGWKSIVMKTVTWVWIAFVLVYMYISWVA